MFRIKSRDHSHVRVLSTASPRKNRRRRPALEGLEDKLLLASYYIAPGGSNLAAGSALHPWATIQKAANSVSAGDTVHVAAGTYAESVTFTRGGSSGSPITFVSDTPHGAKIRSGGNPSYGYAILTIRANYITIQGFDVADSNSTSGGSRNGILSYGNYNRVLNNQVHDIPCVVESGGGSGIDFYGSTSSHCDAIGNAVYRIGNLTNGGNQVQGIYVAIGNCTVSNNIISNVQGYGVQMWHWATAGTITNNLIFECHRGGILVGDGDETPPVTNDSTIVANNILTHNYYNPAIFEEGLTGTHNRYIDNCLYANAVNSISLQNGLTASGTMTSNPLFVNYQANGSGNYHLTSSSPCIDHGTSTGAPATDYDGVARTRRAPSSTSVPMSGYRRGTHCRRRSHHRIPHRGPPASAPAVP